LSQLDIISVVLLTYVPSITNAPDNLAAINALAGMGILTEDDSLVDAALSEILALPLDKRRDLDPGGEVSYLLVQHHLGQVGHPCHYCTSSNIGI
jgi:hypothetical protein